MLPHSRTSAAEARKRLAMELRRAGCDGGVLDDAMLVLSELVGNAVLHGRPLPGGAIEVELRTEGDHVSLAITDGGGLGLPEERNVAELAPSGRGLGIVSVLADDWGVAERRDRMTVWARLQARESTR